MPGRGGGPRRAAALVSLSLFSLAGCGGSEKPADEPRRVTRVVTDDGSGDHDALDVASSRGVLEPEQIQATVEPHGAALSTCYIDHVKGRRWLGGALTIRWEVAADGKVSQAHVVESDLGAWPVEHCLLAVARQLTFPAPRGGAATDFVLPLEFSATGSAARWDELQSAAAIGALLPELDVCTPGFVPAEAAPAAAGKPQQGKPKPAAAPVPPDDGALGPAPAELTLSTPDPGGAQSPRDVVLTLYANPRGQMQSVGFATSATEGLADRWAECAEKIALAWKVPGVRGAVTKLSVRYGGLVAPDAPASTPAP